jgi:hypothetical protein
MTGKVWYVAKEGRQEGPFSIDELAPRFESGELRKDTYVFKAGMANWVAATGRPELISLINSKSATTEQLAKTAETMSGVSNFDVFLSFSMTDERYAERVYQTIRGIGGACFMSKKSLQGGDPFEDNIRKALVGSKELCLFCTPNSMNSEWVLTEWGAAWVLNKRVVPILHRIEVGQLPERLRKYQAIDLADLNLYIKELRLRLNKEPRMNPLNVQPW